MKQKPLRTTPARPTPELPVEDVERAQHHYRDALGFEIGWLSPGGEIGAVSLDGGRDFLSQKKQSIRICCSLVFAADNDATYENCACEAHESSNLSRRSPGVCASSPWKISIETASTCTATDLSRP